MTQYENNTAPKRDINNASDIKDLEQKVRDLAQKTARQAQEIHDLAAQIKRLKNEVRVAVNAFNLKQGGR